MRFHVVPYMPHYAAERGPAAYSFAYLVRDPWNDWFTYVTQYRLVVVVDVDRQHEIGEVKDDGHARVLTTARRR